MARGRQVVRFRRAPHLVAYWRAGSLLLRNYAIARTAAGDPLICRVLDFCSDWRTEAQIRRNLGPDSSPFLPALLRTLVERSLLHRSDRPIDSRERAMASFDRWNPEAGFFHTATKDVRFWSAREAKREARLQAALSAMPRPVLHVPNAARLPLPAPVGDGDFPKVLRARRTWRRFSTQPVTAGELATILALAVGVQKWVGSGRSKIPLKTSPSGGARHPIECYVVVGRIEGVRAGVYHYAADRHELERVRGPVPKDRIRAYLPQSGYFADASAVFFLTAAFERQLWRYPYSRAYRAALIEAGHVCQTLLLCSTWLGLAPFCVMALADSLIERDLGIDGIRESVLYAAGVGRPPSGTDWAPLPRGTLRTRRNPHLR